MTFDENTATRVKKWPLLFLKPQSMELNLSIKIKKNKIGGFYEAVCWPKVWPNMRIWADMGNVKDIAEESQKTHHHRKKSKISKLSLSMAHIFCGMSELGIYAKSDTRVCADSTHRRFPRWSFFSCSDSIYILRYRGFTKELLIWAEKPHEKKDHRGNRLCVESAQTLVSDFA